MDALHAARLLDPTRRIVSAQHVTIPVRSDPTLQEWARRLGAELVEAPDLPARDERPTPREQVQRIVGAPADAHVPDKWELLGDVLVLRVGQAMRPYAASIAAAFAQVLGARCVVEDTAGVAGEYREMAGAILHGSDPVTTHVENGVRYRLDASRLMFSSGNKGERIRVAQLPAVGETVVDMFAGIGYFTLPLAVHARPKKVIALEKNPLAHRYLVEGIEANGVGDVVEPWLGDNREYPEEGIAHRVMMGYFPGTKAFLPKAFRLLRPEGGVVHYHDTAHADSWRDEMVGHALYAARACGAAARVLDAHVVKSHSPGVVHAVVALQVNR